MKMDKSRNIYIYAAMSLPMTPLISIERSINYYIRNGNLFATSKMVVIMASNFLCALLITVIYK